MEKSKVAQDIKRQFHAGVISQKQVGLYLGLGKTAAKNFCRGLDYAKVGTSKLYSADDIAEKLVQSKEIAV